METTAMNLSAFLVDHLQTYALRVDIDPIRCVREPFNIDSGSTDMIIHAPSFNQVLKDPTPNAITISAHHQRFSYFKNLLETAVDRN
jgi:hypothetical protein